MTGMLLIAGALIWFSRPSAPGGSYAADVLGPSLFAAVGLGFAFVPVTIANSRTQNVVHSDVHSATVALTKGFDTAFLRSVARALLACLDSCRRVISFGYRFNAS